MVIDELKDIAQRKAMLLGERNVQAIVSRRRLQLKIESPAETLTQRQSPGLVDAPPERRMQDQLHPSALIKEPLGNDRR